MESKKYVAPALEDFGRLSVVTLGQFFSRCDGNSGTTGNKGGGGGGCGTPGNPE